MQGNEGLTSGSPRVMLGCIESPVDHWQSSLQLEMSDSSSCDKNKLFFWGEKLSLKDQLGVSV